MTNTFEVRPFQSIEDYAQMVDYFTGANEAFLARMGVDASKVPARETWIASAWADHQRPETDPARERFYLAWLSGAELVGHSSINRIRWGDSAYAHLHLWRPMLRQRGVGTALFRRSVTTYFERFALRVLYCEPYALNEGPNRTLAALGFELLRRHITTPTAMAFEQPAHLWMMERDKWLRQCAAG